MVPVVIDDAEGGREILRFKTALGPSEGGQCASNERKLRAAAVGDGDGCECIEDVVFAGDRELDVAQGLAVFLYRESGRAFEIPDLGRGVVGVLGGAFPAIGNRVRALATDLTCDLVLRAVDDGSGGLVGECSEDFLDVIQVAVEIEMLRLDVEYDGMLRAVEGECAVRFVALGNHGRAVLFPAGVRA